MQYFATINNTSLDLSFLKILWRVLVSRVLSSWPVRVFLVVTSQQCSYTLGPTCQVVIVISDRKATLSILERMGERLMICVLSVADCFIIVSCQGIPRFSHVRKIQRLHMITGFPVMETNPSPCITIGWVASRRFRYPGLKP
jgi:hypothetical protein